jgi:hypothetical protein
LLRQCHDGECAPMCSSSPRWRCPTSLERK